MYENLVLGLISLTLLICVFFYIQFLANNNYVLLENFTSGNTQSVDLPINVTYSCSNFCAPGTARCAITGQQCASDLDCPGCQPKINNQSTFSPEVPAANDSGKLNPGLGLNYSPLTHGYGTRNETVISNKEVPQASWGLNTWRDQFNQENAMYQNRYSLPGMQKYKRTETTTGLFDTTGPLPANY